MSLIKNEKKRRYLI